MQIKNGVINRKSSILTKARDNALKNFYNNEGNIIQLQLADLNMYVNKKCKDDDIKTFYTELDNIFSSSHYDEKIKLHPQQKQYY